MTDNHAFTSTVLKYLIDHSSTNIIRIKSDNCATQYKLKYVFKAWHTLAAKTNKCIVTFYGTSGHGKGLVDAMSSFKAPIRRAVLTEDLSYQNAQGIYEDYLTQFFRNDSKKHYYSIEKNEIEVEKKKIQGFHGIQKCRSLHMISYFPDASIQTKQHLCSCAACVA